MATKPRILVVDDESTVRASFDRVLSECGYAVSTAADGPSALQRLQSEPYDVAFVDLRMPGMDGMEVVRTLRATQPGVEVVIVTGYGNETTMVEARNLGVFDFVAKPIAPADLGGLAERAMLKRKAAPSPAVLPPGAPGPVAPPQAAPRPAPQPRSAPQTSAAPMTEERTSPWRAAWLLVAGALRGLLYVVSLPFIGFAMLAWALGQRVYRGLRRAKAK